jgi:transcriptional regulator with XRE-family HTH domain
MKKHPIFAERLIQSTDDKGLKAGWIAARLEVSNASMTKWRAGAVLPGPHNLFALAKLLGVKASWLAGVV